MMFLNALLAAGLTAVAAPVLIHLIHRSRVRPMMWGAMLFLQEVVAQRSRRMQLQDLLLLLIRCLIVGLLALALMRPYVQTPSLALRPDSARTSAVLLLDDSYSMNAQDPQGTFEKARELAGAYLATLRTGDDVSLLTTGVAGLVPKASPLYNLDEVRQRLAGLKPAAANADLPRALVAALAQFEKHHNPHREIVLVTDLQAHGWQMKDPARWSLLLAAWNAALPRPRLIVLDVGQPERPNVAVVALDQSRNVVDPFNDVTFTASVRNAGPKPLQQVTVRFLVDGLVKATRQVDLPAGGVQGLPFEHRFDRPGSHAVAVEVQAAGDTLPDDDRLDLAVEVLDKLPVLLVDGRADDVQADTGGAELLRSAIGFLRLALSPTDKDDPDWRTVIQTSLANPIDLEQLDLSAYRVIVLADVASLTGRAVAELERFVVGGGGLLVCAGPQADAAFYNRELYRGGAGLLPVSVQALEQRDRPEGVAADAAATQPAEFRLAGQVADHPALALFGPGKADWSTAKIRQRWTLGPVGSGAAVRVLASFDDAQPALIERKLGDGRVLLLASALDLRSGDLPLQPYFVPLAQNLVLNLAAAMVPPRNLRIGQTLSYLARGEEASLPHVLLAPAPEPLRIGAPLPKPVTLDLTANRQVGFTLLSSDQTGVQGLYSVVVKPAAERPAEGKEPAPTYYAVTADRGESDATRLSDAEQDKLRRELGAHILRRAEDLATAMGQGESGIELWRWLLVAAVALCFVEIAYTRLLLPKED